MAARAWVKSPSTATCSGSIVSISSARRRSVSSLTPIGAGAPSARKVAALEIGDEEDLRGGREGCSPRQ
jgi:hypothetical protein